MKDEAARKEILNAIDVIKRGGVILYPTDTIWGLGCDATQAKPVERIFKIKKRPESKGFIILLDHFERLYEYVDNVPDIAADLINSFDKPLTIIYPGGRNLCKKLLHPDGSVAIRIVRDEFCKSLVSLFGKPLVATSANLSGDATPPIFSKIDPRVIKAVDYVVDLYHDKIDEVKPSTIIKFEEGGDYKIIRG